MVSSLPFNTYNFPAIVEILTVNFKSLHCPFVFCFSCISFSPVVLFGCVKLLELIVSKTMDQHLIDKGQIRDRVLSVAS